MGEGCLGWSLTLGAGPANPSREMGEKQLTETSPRSKSKIGTTFTLDTESVQGRKRVVHVFFIRRAGCI